MKRSLLLCIAAAVAAASLPSAVAQSGDAPAIDPVQLLDALKKLKEVNEQGVKARRLQALQQVNAAASSPERAVAFWKEAVKSANFEGAEREGAQLRDWRDGEGDALNDRLAQGAVVLHLRWLSLSLQHAAGAETKQLLPLVVNFANDVQADQIASERFKDQIDKAKERNDSGKHGMKKNDVGEDMLVKRVHDQILRSSVGNSPVSRWLQLGELLDGKGKRQKDGPAGWELVPGNVDGIYANIILPEFRASRDPRLLDYWDMVLKRETDKAAERKLDVEQRDWAQVKRPTILWARAQDVLLLGYKNRAIGEMFNLVKTFPQHPDAAGWITQIEATIMGSAAAAQPPVSATVQPTPAPQSGVVPPPTPVPPATGNVPTATIVPTQPAVPQPRR